MFQSFYRVIACDGQGDVSEWSQPDWILTRSCYFYLEFSAHLHKEPLNKELMHK